jgi:hypothetical protein
MEQVFEVNKTETPAVSGKNADIEAGLRGDDYPVQVRDHYHSVCCKSSHSQECSILDDALCLAYMIYLFADVFTELLVSIAGMETVSATRWTRLHGLLSLPGSWKLYVIFPL